MKKINLKGDLIQSWTKLETKEFANEESNEP
jgi:hypothetical protein